MKVIRFYYCSLEKAHIAGCCRAREQSADLVDPLQIIVSYFQIQSSAWQLNAEPTIWDGGTQFYSAYSELYNNYRWTMRELVCWNTLLWGVMSMRSGRLMDCGCIFHIMESFSCLPVHWLCSQSLWDIHWIKNAMLYVRNCWSRKLERGHFSVQN